VQPLLQDATCKSILQSWDTSLALLEEMADKLAIGNKTHPADITAKSETLLTAVLYPDGLFAVKANYSGHVKEMRLDTKKWASMPFFIRPPQTTLVGPGETVIVPKTTKQFDWECELAVFVGKTLHNASKEEAASAVAGYAIGLDLSCRDLIRVNNDLKVDLVRGKAQDTMAPCGRISCPPSLSPMLVICVSNSLPTIRR
jgi:2-keto-4-pentenoate hydratase/2-oxohepta-3-ene-1,7-dioic acid hydratase in catechol pathway